MHADLKGSDTDCAALFPNVDVPDLVLSNVKRGGALGSGPQVTSSTESGEEDKGQRLR